MSNQIGWAVQMENGRFVGIWTDKEMAEKIRDKQPPGNRDRVIPVYGGPADHPFSLQWEVARWMLNCFGEEIAADKDERRDRFLEEALELFQAFGGPKADALMLVDYVFGRPIGERPQEVGGVMVTLAALCQAENLDMLREGYTELVRIWEKLEDIRAKQAAKPRNSPLPEAPK